MLLTIGQTAKAVSLSKTTICKHIENGKISASWNNETNPPQREIDASEIKRAYGVDVTLPPSKRKEVTQTSVNEINAVGELLKAKDKMIEMLEAQLKIKDDQIQNYSRLLAAPKPEEAAVIVMPAPAAPAPIQAATEAVEAIKTEIEAEAPPAEKTQGRGFWRFLGGRKAS